MRQIDDDDYDFDPEPSGEDRSGPSGGLARTVSAWAGTLVALGLLAGGGLWAYGLGTRDPGRIPVIAAVEGPVKINLAASEQEGGAAHQDIASYTPAVPEPEPATVALAPPPPRPAPEDTAAGDLEAMLGLGAVPLPAAHSEPAAAPAEKPPEPRATAARPEEDGIPPEEADDRLAALDPAEAEEGVADAPPEPEAPAGPVPPAGEGSDLAPAVSPAVSVRPIDLRRRIAAASEEAVADALALAERAAKSPYQIQLGAFRNEVLTREQWQLISGTHAELLHNRTLAVQKTLSGGKTFYRLRVGPFASREEAASLCQALEARGQTCIVARNDG